MKKKDIIPIIGISIITIYFVLVIFLFYYYDTYYGRESY